MNVRGMGELNKIIPGFIPLTNIPLTFRRRHRFGRLELRIRANAFDLLQGVENQRRDASVSSPFDAWGAHAPPRVAVGALADRIFF